MLSTSLRDPFMNVQIYVCLLIYEDREKELIFF